MIPSIKALTFDTFGTVVDWRSSIINDLSAFGRTRGLDTDWTAFVDEWKTAYKPGMDKVRKGEWPWTTIDGIYRRALDAMAPRYGLDRLDEASLHHINRVWHRLLPWPDSVPALTRLKKKFLISTLSNGDVAMLANMAKVGGLPWDAVLCGQVFRHFKPDPEIYLGAIELLGCEPHEVMMVAAHNDDLKHARSHGMRTGFVLRASEYGPAQKTNLKASEQWDVVANDLGELASALGA
jgi:2-haloacid dehalogenase